MRKLDESKVKWIINQKKKGQMTNRQIADTMHVSIIWVQKLNARYKRSDIIKYPKSMGRPKNGMYGRMEHSAVLYVHGMRICGAVSMSAQISDDMV